MKKDTKKSITTLLKRSAFLFSVAFLIFSCNSDDDDNFDCEDIQANFGEVCDSAGIISTACTCITTLNEDTTGTDIYDCPNWELNIGDACADGTGINGNILVEGFLDANCNCINVEDTTNNQLYDCPDLMLDYGDSCGKNAYVDSNCDCINFQDTTNNVLYDCPDLMQNFGDSCWVISSDSIYGGGIIDLNCACTGENFFD